MNLNFKKYSFLIVIAMLVFSLVPSSVSANRSQRGYSDNDIGYTLTADFHKIEYYDDLLTSSVDSKMLKSLTDVSIHYSTDLETAFHQILNYNDFFGTSEDYFIVDTFLTPLTAEDVAYLITNNISDQSEWNKQKLYDNGNIVFHQTEMTTLNEDELELINNTFLSEIERTNLELDNIEVQNDIQENYTEFDENFLGTNVKSQYRNILEDFRSDIITDDSYQQIEATNYLEASVDDLDDDFKDNMIKVIAYLEEISVSAIEINDYNVSELYEITRFSDKLSEDIESAFLDAYAGITDFLSKVPVVGSILSDNPLIDAVQTSTGAISSAVKGTADRALKTISDVGAGIKNIGGTVSNTIGGLKDKSKSVFRTITSPFTSIINKTKNALNFIPDSLAKGFSLVGGIVQKALPILLIILGLIVLAFGAKFYLGYRAKNAVASRV